ncbi:MAG: dTDP-glucose 4,6-dehydratase [Cyanobacteria bacterium J06642_2]
MSQSTLLVTGGAGFIGANFILMMRQYSHSRVITLDKLTYAGHIQNLEAVRDDSLHTFVRGDIGDRALVDSLLRQYQPNAIINFAAESHVDRSILAPATFIQTNVVGVFHLLEAARAYWGELTSDALEQFRFLHVSTDEVYGSLDNDEPAFTEKHPYQPNSPYSASKAASDHLVRAYHHTYGLPTLTTNCSNNYGPYHYPEKLIPLTILNALQGKILPIYGDGENIRDWLFVEDHCRAIRIVLENGKVGETYNIGGWNERTNVEVVHAICDRLDALRPRDVGSYRDLIQFVADRPGHDRRYAINANKIARELNWQPEESFETGLHKTILWYLDHMDWVNSVTEGHYQEWIDQQY